MLENGLTFGSFSSELVKEASSDNCTNGCNDSNIESSHETAASARLVTEILQCLLLSNILMKCSTVIRFDNLQ